MNLQSLSGYWCLSSGMMILHSSLLTPKWVDFKSVMSRCLGGLSYWWFKSHAYVHHWEHCMHKTLFCELHTPSFYTRTNWYFFNFIWILNMMEFDINCLIVFVLIMNWYVIRPTSYPRVPFSQLLLSKLYYL